MSNGSAISAIGLKDMKRIFLVCLSKNATYKGRSWIYLPPLDLSDQG